MLARVEDDKVGGTTAWSGGQAWIPNNPHMPDVGVQDSRDKAITYIMSLSRDMIDRRLVEAYVDAGPQPVRQPFHQRQDVRPQRPDDRLVTLLGHHLVEAVVSGVGHPLPVAEGTQDVVGRLAMQVPAEAGTPPLTAAVDTRSPLP